MIEKIVLFSQIFSAVLVIVLILVQNREGGLSGVFGGGDSGNVYRTKRGMEKKIFILTIIFAILFIGLSLANTILNA